MAYRAETGPRIRSGVGRLVYSTESGRMCPQYPKPVEACTCTQAAAGGQRRRRGAGQSRDQRDAAARRSRWCAGWHAARWNWRCLANSCAPPAAATVRSDDGSSRSGRSLRAGHRAAQGKARLHGQACGWLRGLAPCACGVALIATARPPPRRPDTAPSAGRRRDDAKP